MTFIEHHRWMLNYMFRNMTAWGIDWLMTWEYALVESGNDVNAAMQFLDEFVTKREARSINSALRKAGFNHTVVARNC